MLNCRIARWTLVRHHNRRRRRRRRRQALNSSDCPLDLPSIVSSSQIERMSASLTSTTRMRSTTLSSSLSSPSSFLFSSRGCGCLFLPVGGSCYQFSTPNAFLTSDDLYLGSRRNSSSSSSSSGWSRYNHYETLGVAEDATPLDIKKAFYSLSKRCHPDLHPDDERMSGKFKSLTQAYETLIDGEKRNAYDIDNGIGKSQQQRWRGDSSVGDLKDAHFGDDAKDEWIRDQRRKMKQRLEEEDRQFKKEWKEMMRSRSMTPGEAEDDHHPLYEEDEKKWQEIKNKSEERKKERQKEFAFQNKRIALHPALYYFYNMNWDWLMSTVCILGVVGGLAYVFYVIKYKDTETVPDDSMPRQFAEEEATAAKKARQRQLDAKCLAAEIVGET